MTTIKKSIVALRVWTRGDRYAEYASPYIKERKHKRDKRPDGYFVQNTVTDGPVLAVDFGAGSSIFFFYLTPRAWVER